MGSIYSFTFLAACHRWCWNFTCRSKRSREIQDGAHARFWSPAYCTTSLTSTARLAQTNTALVLRMHELALRLQAAPAFGLPVSAHHSTLCGIGSLFRAFLGRLSR